MKRCSTCGEDKDLSEFSPHKSTRDGRQPRCKSCTRAKAREWRTRDWREMDRSYVSDRFNENVTKGDGCWIWTGSTTDKGYAVLTLRGKNISAHRFSYEFHTGERIDDVEIDHRCRVRACVNPEHLRKSTRKRNQQNLTGARSDNRTGVRGVGWSSSNGRYRVRVTVAGKTIWGGYFDDLAEAEAAAIALRNEHMTDNETDRA